MNERPRCGGSIFEQVPASCKVLAGTGWASELTLQEAVHDFLKFHFASLWFWFQPCFKKGFLLHLQTQQEG
jgi:hypothetical protein